VDLHRRLPDQRLRRCLRLRGHHEGVDANESGIAIIDAGHYGVEHIFINDMKKRLLNIDENLEVIAEKIKLPESFY